MFSCCKPIKGCVLDSCASLTILEIQRPSSPGRKRLSISASRMAAKPCAHLLLYNPLQAFATMWVLSRERHSLKIMSSEIPGNLLLVSSTEQDRLTHARNLLLLSFFLDQRCIVSLRTHDTWDKSFSKVQDIISTLSWINPSNAGAAHIDPNVVVSPKS